MARDPRRRLSIAALAMLASAAPAHAAKPSFDCAKAAGSIQKMVCADAELAALDRRLAQVYDGAVGKAGGKEGARELRATQRGWVKGRDDCWKAQDRRECTAFAYRDRIVELQARYALVKSTGPVAFSCNGNPADEVTVTYYDTEPRSLIAERGDQTSLMVQQPAASGTHYVGRNESLREHQGELKLVWGYGAPEMPCAKKP